MKNLSISKRCLVCFDIDGVLLSNWSPIPKASESLKLLRQYGIPYMFLTNGSPCTEKERISQLETILNVDNTDCLMMMAQSPLREMTDLHDKNVLFVGSLDVRNTAKSAGFKNVIEMSQITERYPLLDASIKDMDLNRIKPKGNVPTIDAIVILDDPKNYETYVQILIDVIFTNGTLDHSIKNYPMAEPPSNMIQKVPVLAMCTDYLWTSDAPWPRLCAGFFLQVLEHYFESLSGQKLKYQSIYGKPSLDTYLFLSRLVENKYGLCNIDRIYFIGDNLLTDIYGANVFKRYLREFSHSVVNPNLQVYSILVKSGVYRGENIDKCHGLMNLLHYTTVKDAELLYPDHIFGDALEATKYILMSCQSN